MRIGVQKPLGRCGGHCSSTTVQFCIAHLMTPKSLRMRRALRLNPSHTRVRLTDTPAWRERGGHGGALSHDMLTNAVVY